MEKGKVIVIEGACDGIGKTTQFELLKKHLIDDGKTITSHHFPSYNEYQGVAVENYLKGEFGSPSELSPYFINSLYAVDRAITWKTDLEKMYRKGNTILLDRYTTSSLIYQSALIEDLEEKKKFIDYIIDFEYNKLGIKKPDNVIFLYTSFELATKMRNDRKNNEGVDNDIHESNLSFMKKVYENAMFLADYLSWNKIRCDQDDKMRTIEDIHSEIYSSIE